MVSARHVPMDCGMLTFHDHKKIENFAVWKCGVFFFFQHSGALSNKTIEKVCFRKHLDKGVILRAASLAEIGGYVGDNWVDWTGVLF